MRKLLIFILLLATPMIGNAGSFGVGLGSATVDIDSDGTADRVDDQDSYLKVFGGIDIIEYLAVELGYIDFGKYSAHYVEFDETDTATATAFTASAVGRFPATDTLTVFARLGAQFWNAEYNADGDVFGTPVTGGGDGSGSGLFAGIGLDFKLGSLVTLRLEAEQYSDVGEDVTVSFEDIGSVEAAGSDVDMYGVALIFRFE